MSDKVKTYRIS